MEYIIGAILLLITLITIGLILRKKVYDRVDKLEEWKLEVMNKDVTNQLSKVKELNLSGETQTRFEKWRTEWDHIVTRKMPDIEEDLLDAEEAADRYRFRSAKKILNEVSRTIEIIEVSIEKMFEEVDALIISKEDSSKEIEFIRPRVKETRKYLLQNRYQFGKAEVVFDVELDEIEDQLSHFEDLTNKGNYLEAQHLVQDANARLQILNHKIKVLPLLYRTCKTDLPEQLDELISGLKEMKDNGHQIHHFGFEKEIHKHHEQLLILIEMLHQGEIDGVENTIIEIEERIQEIFHQLEEEALAKTYTEKHVHVMYRSLEEIEKDLEKTKSDVKILQESYHFKDEDQETQLNLENGLKQLKLQSEKMERELDEEKKNYSHIRSELEGWIIQWENLHQQHVEFQNKIKSLRQDELQAKEKINNLVRELAHVRRRLQKSNLPGVPEYIYNAISEVAAMIDNMNVKLDQHPLKIDEINYALTKAEKNTVTAVEQTDYLFEQAYLAEYVIQYANRYRSQYPMLAAQLSEAENAFRNWDYELALEHAGNGLEEIEPGAVKRLEEIMRQQVGLKR
ncbi:septation ring formation regulator [Salirhabdus euzebyi]|uniref:Septation ring formation regulator EzrA n=1 Tax=Salirhabdus euzebyi TaxID=394506 RepID=A0A841PXF7_9BACI|nr:septation ring formation regulator EzrA [Salirhabdus euzebyi]MBB6452126.1 septation ring formation regulator [Salirhabdus euzebyi]